MNDAVETRRRESPPSLLPSYARALLGGLIPGGGGELPEHAVSIDEIGIDRVRVAAYARACGYPVRDAVPVTYPHVLGFPLAMSLMSERSFPFALLGLVHVANRIEQRRPLSLAERPALRVWAENVRPHRRGRQLDLVTEVTAEGEIAWREHSTYLRQGKDGDDGGSRQAGPSEPGEALWTSALWHVSGDVGRRYAEVSGDRNPIHLHPLAARLFGFPKAIAHGMWMKARCLAAFEGRVPDACTAEVEFRSPLLLPAKARLRSGRSDGGWAFVLERPDGERPHLTGSIAPVGV
jgi:acyl dehydratase